jgi:hypothetical protein
MADPNRRPGDEEGVPPAAAEGMDPYPTYRDGPVPPHVATASKPTDVRLPRSRRTYALPILIGLIVFGLVILIRLLWGGVQLVESTDEAMSPGDASAPAATAPAEAGSTSATGDAPESEGTLDRNVQPDTGGAGPGEVGAEPGPVDVPGGATTTPVEPAPQQ